MKFGTLQQILNPITVTWPKNENFKIQDGGDRHLENRFFGHNSSTGCPISAKFCTRKQDGMSTRATWQILQTFEIQHCGRHMSVKNHPILMKFGTLQQILNPMTVTWPEIEFLKFKMATAAIKIALLTITRQPIVLFQRNFVPGSRTACWQRPRVKNLQIIKIQDGGRRLFWKSFNHHISVKKIIRFWQNLVYYRRYWTWWDFEKRYRSILDVII